MKYLIQNKFWNIVEDYNKENLLYLLIDRPDYINRFDEFIWKNNKNLWHRDYDLPAYIWDDGEIWWYKNNILHRESNKPYTIYSFNEEVTCLSFKEF